MWHLQADVNDWTRTLPILQQGIVKCTSNWQRFREVKAANPQLRTVHRHVRDDLQTYWGNAGSPWFDREIAKSMARAWFDTFIDGTFREQLASVTDAVSWHNEIWADSQTTIEREERYAATHAAVSVWNSEYRPTFSRDIRLIIGEAAVGNDMPRDIAFLAIDSDNLLGYHPYTYWSRGIRGHDDWRYLSGRWHFMEQPWGLRPTWVFTEAGPFESAVTGWRSKECLNGDRVAYVEAVRAWLHDVQQTPAYLQGRIWGFALFTSGGSSQWSGFETRQPEMDMLAAMIRDEWKPKNPPPPPSNEQNKRLWAASVEEQIATGIPLNPNAAIQKAIYAGGRIPVHREIVVEGITIQAAESLDGSTPRRLYCWTADKGVWSFARP